MLSAMVRLHCLPHSDGPMARRTEGFAVERRLPIVCRSGKICKWHCREPRQRRTDSRPSWIPAPANMCWVCRRGPSGCASTRRFGPSCFESRPRSSAARFGELALDVQHVGSTAVPGLKAKPILDIAVAIPAHAIVPKCATSLARLGYQYAYWVELDNDFTFEKGIERTHHVHLVEHDSRQWSDYLRFRDALRANANSRANTSASSSSWAPGSAAIARPTRARRPSSSAACCR